MGVQEGRLGVEVVEEEEEEKEGGGGVCGLLYYCYGWG